MWPLVKMSLTPLVYGEPEVRVVGLPERMEDFMIILNFKKELED